MDDFFHFMVMNSWKINMNLPFLFGDRHAVRCQIWVYNFSSQNLYWVGNCALKDGYFFSREEGGGTYLCCISKLLMRNFGPQLNT